MDINEFYIGKKNIVWISGEKMYLEKKKEIEYAIEQIKHINRENIKEFKIGKSDPLWIKEAQENNITLYESASDYGLFVKNIDSIEEYVYGVKWWAYREYQEMYSHALEIPNVYGKIFKKIADNLFKVESENYVFYIKRGRVFMAINEYEMDITLRNKNLNIFELMTYGEEYYICIDNEVKNELFRFLRKKSFKRDIQNILNDGGDKRLRNILGYLCLKGIKIKNIV